MAAGVTREYEDDRIKQPREHVALDEVIRFIGEHYAEELLRNDSQALLVYRSVRLVGISKNLHITLPNILAVIGFSKLVFY